MPKIVDRNEMKKMILDAALRTFFKYGFKVTTMQKIAEEANIAKGTLYLYYDSKALLINEITNIHFEKMKEKYIPTNYFESLDDLLENLRSTLKVDKAESKLFVLFFEGLSENFSKPGFMKKYAAMFHAIGEFYIQNCDYLAKQNKINTSYEYFGRALVSMIDGMILHKSFFELKNKHYEKMIDETIEVLRRGLVKG